MMHEDEDLYQDFDDIGDNDLNNNLIVYSRDWTVATILSQIEQGNIELNPGFQRRNAWTDTKRSKLIESILIGFPIPEIVLAENKGKRNSFIVIDGKQRLLSIAGFKNPAKFQYWSKKVPKTSGLKSKYDGITFSDISNDNDALRNFENSALRCTVISNYTKEDDLYDIFYRLNAGSTPLSSQELRQALNKGPFSNFLIQVTEEDNILRRIMNINEPDKRLRDIEVLVRCMSFLEYASNYKGNLLHFLDTTTKLFNKRWNEDSDYIINLKNQVYEAITKLVKVFGNENEVARKYKNGDQKSQFNRVILEVLVYFFCKIDEQLLTENSNKLFVAKYKELFDNDFDFQATIDGSTKNLENYNIRYSRIQDIINDSYNLNLTISPFKYVQRRLGK